MKTKIGLIIILFIAFSCKKDKIDKVSPEEVSNLNLICTDSLITIMWNDPLDGDLSKIDIAYNDTTIEVLKGVQSIDIRNLVKGKNYTFILRTIDNNGNTSKGIQIQGKLLLFGFYLPVDNFIYIEDSSVYIELSKYEQDATISLVELYIDDVLRETLTIYPYKYEWHTNHQDNGVHIIKAIAYNNQNKIANAIVHVSVLDYRYRYTGNFSFFSYEWGVMMGNSTHSDTMIFNGSVSINENSGSLILIKYRDGPQTTLCGSDSVFGAYIEPDINVHGELSYPRVLDCSVQSYFNGKFSNFDRLNISIGSGGQGYQYGQVIWGKRIK